MKHKTKAPLKRKTLSRRTKPRKLHHKVISFFRGDGGIYVIFILATVMAGSFALTGGILPRLDPAPSASNEVTIDPDSANQSSESALQLVDLKVKPTATPPPSIEQCLTEAAVAIVIDTSGSMATVDPGQTQTRIARLREALTEFLTFFKPDTAVTLIDFASTGRVLVPFAKLSQNSAALNTAINDIAEDSSGSTNMKNGLEDAVAQFRTASTTFPNYKQYTIFMSDGVPESGDCRYRRYTGPTNPYHYHTTTDNPALCYLEGTRTEPTMFTHKSSPIQPANTLKATGKIYSLAFFDTSSDPFEIDKWTKAENLMKAVASDPDSTYYLHTPTTSNLTAAYQEIARKVCPTP